MSKLPPNPTNENPSSTLPTQNNKPITPPTVTPRQGEFISLSSSQGELSGTSEPELPAQTPDLPIPPFPVSASPPPSANQSDTKGLAAHATQGGQNNSMIAPLPANETQRDTSGLLVHAGQDNIMRAPLPANEKQTETAGPSSHANPPPRLFPVYGRARQSPNQQIQRNPNQNFQHQCLPITVPWSQRNALMAIEGCQHPNEYHRMNRLRKSVLNYFFVGGLSITATWAERPTLSTSIYIQCFLNQVAFSLLLLAHFVFPRTNPAIAFIMDRLSFSLIVISGYLSTMPMYPPYIAIIMLLVVVMVYIFSRFRG